MRIVASPEEYELVTSKPSEVIRKQQANQPIVPQQTSFQEKPNVVEPSLDISSALASREKATTTTMPSPSPWPTSSVQPTPPISNK